MVSRFESSIVHLFSVLMFCFVCISSTYVFGTLLTANGDLRVLNLLQVLIVVVNIGLNLLFIPGVTRLGSCKFNNTINGHCNEIIVSKKKFDSVRLLWLYSVLLFVFGVLSFPYFLFLCFKLGCCNGCICCSFVFASLIRMIQ